MGAILSFLRRKRGEGEELRRRCEDALCPSSLAPTGGSYVILNVASEDLGDSELLALTHSQKSGKHFVSLGKWKGSGGNDASEQIFKIEKCTDYRDDCVVTCYGNKEPKVQWVVDDERLEIEAYRESAEERLRPPEKQWRFRFEEISPPGSKMYRIVSMYDDLDGIDCLALQGFTESGLPKLGFKRRKDDDRTQLWYLNSR